MKKKNYLTLIIIACLMIVAKQSQAQSCNSVISNWSAGTMATSPSEGQLVIGLCFNSSIDGAAFTITGDQGSASGVLYNVGGSCFGSNYFEYSFENLPNGGYTGDMNITLPNSTVCHIGWGLAIPPGCPGNADCDGDPDNTDCSIFDGTICHTCVEICGDGIDQNCNGMADDVCQTQTWYLDADNDGYYIGSPVTQTNSPGTGWKTTVTGGNDCDDACYPCHPTGTEVACNGLDEDCIGGPDNSGCPLTWTGATTNEWKKAANWNPQQIPTATDDVLIPAGLSVYPVSAATNTCFSLTIEAGASLTMTGGVMSIYESITAPSASCFNLAGGKLKLYTGSDFPADMTFNNLNIYANPIEPNDVALNTYRFPGTAVINGTLTIEGNNQLPKIRMVENEHLSIGMNLVIKGGLIGMDAEPAPGLHDDLPVVIFYGTSTQNLNINNSLDCQLCGNEMGADLAILNPNVNMVQNNLSIYNLILSSNFNLKGNNLDILGKMLYSSSSTSITNTKTNLGTLIIENQVPKDDEQLELRVAALENLITDASSFSNSVTLGQDLIIAGTLSVVGTLLPLGHNITIGKTNTSIGFLDLSDPIDNLGFTSGTLKLLGNASTPRYKLKASSLYNFTLNSPAGVELANDIGNDLSIYGMAKLTQGQFDVKTNIVKFIQPNGLAKETAGHTFYTTQAPLGLIFTETTNNTTSTNLNLGGLGFLITTNNPLQDIVIYRAYLSNLGLNNNTSIIRTYKVQNTAQALNATIKLHYDDTELNGIPESNLRIFQSTDGITWQMLNSSVNTTTNYVTANGVQQIDLTGGVSGGGTGYTLGDVNYQMRLDNPDNESEQTTTETDGLLLYPNPTKDHLEITLNCSYSNNHLEVINLMGKLMMNKTISADDNGKCHEEIDISRFPQGVYLVRVANETGVMVKKFVKE